MNSISTHLFQPLVTVCHGLVFTTQELYRGSKIMYSLFDNKFIGNKMIDRKKSRGVRSGDRGGYSMQQSWNVNFLFCSLQNSPHSWSAYPTFACILIHRFLRWSCEELRHPRTASWSSYCSCSPTSFLNHIFNNSVIIKFITVHRCGTSGSMRAYHAAGPVRSPVGTSFLGEVFFGLFPHL